MEFINRIIVRFLSCLLLLFSNTAYAVEGNIRISELIVTKRDVNLHVSFYLTVPGNAVASKFQKQLRPHIFNEKGEAWLDPITINGNLKQKQEEQKAALSNSVYNPVFLVKRGTIFAYVKEIAYEDWMGTNITLELGVTQHGCCDVDTLESIYGAELTFLRVPATIKRTQAIVSNTKRQAERIPFLRPVDAKDSTLTDRGSPLRFRQGSAQLYRTYMSNDETLKTIDDALSILQSDNKALLSKISIMGFASPEGDPELNYILSEKRAKALRDEIVLMHPEISEDQFEIIAGGEDWQGLRKLVAQSEMRYRDEILDIIDNTPEGSIRELRLRRLRGGAPYRSLIDLIYPQLRDACYIRVWFEEKPDMEAKIINSAIEDIERNLIDDALEQLLTVEYDQRSWNALGTCYLIKGEIAKARHYFVQAVDAGNDDAKSNLLLISTKETINLETN
jgi:outer membrane protein OmpA-like peptidoglycan-associated protein